MQGMIQKVATDGQGSPWLLTATSRGYLTLWDMRFQIPLTQWQHPSKAPIDALAHAKAPAGMQLAYLCTLCLAPCFLSNRLDML